MKIIIFGANELGAMIATELYASNDITVIDSEKNKTLLQKSFEKYKSYAILNK